MPNLELSRFSTSPDRFRLFKEDGEEIVLPNESEWTWEDAENGWPDFAYAKLWFPLEAGLYWLVEHNNNVTYLKKVTVDDEVEQEEASYVVNGFEGQHTLLYIATAVAPRSVVEAMVELSGVKTVLPTKIELGDELRKCERGCKTEADYYRKIEALDVAKGLDFDVCWNEADGQVPAYASCVNVYAHDMMLGTKLVYQL